MDKNKGKSVTTSVPSISIKFHANAEQIEEFYTSGEENNVGTEKADKGVTILSSSPLNIEQENNPLKLIPKLVKRSTSIDVGHTQQLDASPPSDPWRFFSDIKGKITKSVEDKITEIKARNNEEGSPQHRAKIDKTSELKTIKDSKENSSVSDSEDLSESSISRTCGIVSTTEGVEMSSDEDTPSLEKDKIHKDHSSLTTGLRHRFRFLRSKVESEEGFVKTNDLSKLYNINVENNDQVLPTEDAGDVESAVDALEDEDLKNGGINATNTTTGEEVLQKIAERIANIELDEENGIKITEVTGTQIRDEFFDCKTQSTKTVFAPSGFVDLRPMITETRRAANYVQLLVIFLSIALYVILHYYSPFLGGLAAGAIVCFLYFQLYLKLTPLSPIKSSPLQTPSPQLLPNKILEVQAVKEYQPLQKYEGWANEYPDAYSPETYHISRTQSVYLRLQGNLLRLSHSRSKVPKRAMWNEPEIVANFTHHRIYNLIGAKITLLPEGLTKKRLWSKKYPICITLSKDQMCFDSEVLAKLESEDEKNLDRGSDKEKESAPSRHKKTFGRFRKKEYHVMAQRFSKLNEDNFDLDSDSRASTPSGEFSDVPDSPGLGDEDLPAIANNAADMELLSDDICLNRFLPKETNPSEIAIYLFGRTDREKEDWFRRLTTATHKEIGFMSTDTNNPDDIKEPITNPLIEAAEAEMEYLRYMNVYKTSNKSQKTSIDTLDKPEEQEESTDPKSQPILWLNALIGRVLFDCVRDPSFINKVKDRIERKLSTIKLPYFIEELLIPELSLGKTAPFIKKTGKPFMDDRGLWIDLDIVYKGLIVLTLQTKLNLMRLKNPQAYEKRPTPLKLAIYNSDIDDSAESSSDEDGPQEVSTILNDSSGKSSESGGKKFIRMVDKITESKFFQVATDNRYIKKAMEGVSNTDLRLTVEVKSIVGTLVLNIPPPPSDRIWIGFRPIPEILLSARPIVGERHVSYMIVTNWIEKKLVQEFQKVMVIPNMEDFAIPVMNPKLPE